MKGNKTTKDYDTSLRLKESTKAKLREFELTSGESDNSILLRILDAVYVVGETKIVAKVKA